MSDSVSHLIVKGTFGLLLLGSVITWALVLVKGRQRWVTGAQDRRFFRALPRPLRLSALEALEGHRGSAGRVARAGTVRVNPYRSIERYSHVMHIVSGVCGELAPQRDAFDLFAAAFPAGTLVGAPKVRAMQIIEELEPTRRGIYGGSVLYADFAGNLDSCIGIRTLLMQGKHAYLQAGAGIVADSNPASEFEESMNKAQALLRAVDMARNRG